jgi:hypothetical protein
MLPPSNQDPCQLLSCILTIHAPVLSRGVDKTSILHMYCPVRRYVLAALLECQGRVLHSQPLAALSQDGVACMLPPGSRAGTHSLLWPGAPVGPKALEAAVPAAVDRAYRFTPLALCLVRAAIGCAIGVCADVMGTLDAGHTTPSRMILLLLWSAPAAQVLHSCCLHEPTC